MSNVYFVYAVRDSKSETFGFPFYKLNNDVALSEMEKLRNDPRGYIYHHPEDYDLFCLGELDVTTGKITGHVSPLHITSFLSLPVWEVQTEMPLSNPTEADGGPA